MGWREDTKFGVARISELYLGDTNGSLGTKVTATAAELNSAASGMSGVTATPTELNYLDIATLGTGAASKAVVLDAGEDFIWPATGQLTYGGTAITATGAELNYLDIAALGTGAASKAVVLDTGEDFVWPSGGQLTYGGTAITATGAELNYLDIAVLGTGAASKAVVLDAGEDFTWPATGQLTYGGTAITATGAELNYLDITTLGTGAASKAVVLDAGEDFIWPATGELTYGGTAITATGAELNILDDCTATTAELNYLDIAVLGTGAASKAVVLDAGEDFIWPATGQLTYGGTAITANGAELNYLDITTLGTGAASKAVVLDAGEDFIWPATGQLTYGGTAITANGAELNYVDLTALGTAEASKALVFDANGKIDVGAMHSGAAAANSLFMGGGTSADPMETASADKCFLEFRGKSTATSGDSRFAYIRFDLAGDGVSGEAVRAFTKLTGTAATARGAHISLDITATKGVTGLGVGVDAQVLCGDGVIAGGTLAALNLEWYAAGTSVDISGLTNSSFLRVVLGGDDTGNDNIEDNVNLMTLSGGTAAASNMVGANNVGDATFANWVPIRVDIYGTTHYLIAAQAIS